MLHRTGDDKVNTMTADALVTRVATASAVIALALHDKRVCVP